MHWGDPALNAVIGGGLLTLLTLVWAALAVTAGSWGKRWRLEASEGGPVEGSVEGPAKGPKLSVCVPARDEARCIAACVEAVFGSDHGDFELVLVDDRSSDDTSALALAAAAGDPRFRLVQGSAPPQGWAGKPWACQRAAGEASGDLLLFIDADVQVAPWALRAAATCMEAEQLDMLSLFGDWELKSFWERAVVPVVGWFIRGAIDLDAVNDPSRPQAFANGQFIMVRRDAYDSIGGHEAVKAEVLDDVRIAQALKRRAKRCGLRFSPGSFRVRLYTSLGEIVAGYTKNLYEGMDRRPLVGIGAVMFVMLSTLMPYVALAALLGARAALGWQLVSWPWLAWLAGICVLVHLFRWRQERADGRSGWHSLTHPIGNLVFVTILLRSIIGVESEWKGRRFVDGKAQQP